eukprot:988444-Alexandrium_andersonii.AAC.1
MGASPERPRSKRWSCFARPGRRGSSRVATWVGAIRPSSPARLLISRQMRQVSPTISCKRGT